MEWQYLEILCEGCIYLININITEKLKISDLRSTLSMFVCLLELMLNIPVNSNGEDVASILWNFYPNLGCHDKKEKV